ncbi:MAG: FecR domain-containing protein [Candidatus Omnitrophica bacterium]|nr:FecR domain-containing protein [Candidatus Omnitrophota bacterium]
MRKNTVFFSILISIATCYFFNSPLSYAEEEVAEIVGLSGTVLICLEGEEEYAAASDDMFLKAGDAIETKDDSYAELVFEEEGENIVRMESGSRAVFTLEENEKIELLEGEIFSTLNRLSGDATFEIKTPSAVAGVRGTDWITKVDDTGATEIETLGGSVYVKGLDGESKPTKAETVVSAGYATRIKQLQSPSRPAMFSHSRREKLRLLKNDVRGRAQQVIRKRRQEPGFYNRRDRMEKSRKEWLNHRSIVPHKGGVPSKGTLPLLPNKSTDDIKIDQNMPIPRDNKDAPSEKGLIPRDNTLSPISPKRKIIPQTNIIKR